jgi:uncharacterized protein involved in exopolysaccharide biosynthesis
MAALVLTPEEVEERPPRRRRARPAPIVYVVEVAPTTPDPKAAAQVAAWLRERLR